MSDKQSLSSLKISVRAKTANGNNVISTTEFCDLLCRILLLVNTLLENTYKKIQTTRKIALETQGKIIQKGGSSQAIANKDIGLTLVIDKECKKFIDKLSYFPQSVDLGLFDIHLNETYELFQTFYESLEK